jgi:copper chaperone CopZ
VEPTPPALTALATVILPMKTLPSLLVASLSLCRIGAAPPATANQTNWFKVTGMHCNGCASGIRSELRRTTGVADASVNLTNQLAMIAYDTNQVSVKQLVGVIKEAGYGAKLSKPR